MGRKILIVGGVAGGASVAARARRIDESAEIILFERGPHVSFSNCALPYYLSGIVANPDSLLMMSPEKFKKSYNIEARVSSEVVSIDRQFKLVQIKNRIDGTTYSESYDTLVLSPGASPIRPRSIGGIDKKHVFTVRNVVDITRIKDYLDAKEIKEAAVVGGGFIGIEVMENLTKAGVKVTLVEAADQIMAPFDRDMVQILHKEILDNGVNLIVGDGVEEITDSEVVLVSGKRFPAGAVILAIGVTPETGLAKDCGLEIGRTGGIRVNHNYQTSDEDIYAVGDAIEVHDFFTGKPKRLALAGPAQRQARAAADAMYGMQHNNTGVIGSSAVRVFGLNAASTGLNEKACMANEIDYDFVYVIAPDKVGLMPGSAPLHFKLIYAVPSGKLLGAQAIGKGEADKRINVMAAMIMMGGTIEDLKELELCYSPVYGTAKDVVNMAALVATNVLYGRFKQVPVTITRELVESGAVIIDVREKNEFAAGHLLTAKNIPLSELRERAHEIPSDVPVYLHCRSSQRSYNACMALQGLGYENIYNISGSFLGISLYEYFNDITKERRKIVTEYNFK